MKIIPISRCLLLIIILSTLVSNDLTSMSKKNSSDNETLSSVDNQSYTLDNTIKELSLLFSIPANKLKEGMGISEDTDINTPLRDLGLTGSDVEKAKKSFYKHIWSYSLNIVIVGMVVIFASLVLTGIFVSQLQFIARDPKTVRSIEILSLIPKRSTDKPEIGRNNAVIAAITAIHLHLMEAEESNRMKIAWNREPVSVWKTSSKFLMPNKVQETRRGFRG